MTRPSLYFSSKVLCAPVNLEIHTSFSHDIPGQLCTILYDLTNLTSDEGDTSEESFLSDDERIEYTDAAWSSEGGELLASRRRYLCVPPPSPTFVPPRSVGLCRRRVRRDVAGRTYLERRRILVCRRTVTFRILRNLEISISRDQFNRRDAR